MNATDDAPSLKPGRYSLEVRYGLICVICADCDQDADPVAFLTRHIDDDHARDVWQHEAAHHAAVPADTEGTDHDA